VLAMILALMSLAAPQPPPGPAFEVASIKPNVSGDVRVSIQSLPGGRFTAINAPLRALIRHAYQLQDFELSGGPKRIDAERVDIVARAEGDPAPAQMRLMLRNLLADHFKLQLHTETRDLPFYALVLARRDGRIGPNLRRNESDCSQSAPLQDTLGITPGAGPPDPDAMCGFFGPGPGGSATFRGVTIEVLARFLAPPVQRPVFDRTGLTGYFDADLEPTAEFGPPPPPPGVADRIDRGSLPSIFTVLQERLGLKLDAQRGPVTVFVIDRLEHPVAPQPAQADRFLEKLLQHRYALSIRGGQFSDAGAPILQSAIAHSRFVLLGEDHGAVQTAEFMAALCAAVAPHHFSAIAIEEGPLAAAELEERTRRPDGLSQLLAFEQAFPDSIGVYNTREEVNALQQCARAAPSAFHLWGLNQEGLNGAGLILSRVLATPGLGADARTAMQQLSNKNDEAYQRALRTSSIFDFFMIAADEKELAADAALLSSEGSPEAQRLFASLIESHEINRAPPVEYTNARRRERLMKTLFAANYGRAAAATSTPPKVLLRFGAYHLYRGLNPVRGSGIGNYIAELAEAQGAQSPHIRLMPVKASQPIHQGSRTAGTAARVQLRRAAALPLHAADLRQSAAVRLDAVRFAAAAPGMECLGSA
jgi:uncharacterized protein (TIGR03435 family)